MRTYGNFNDFVDFSRSSGGTALRPISYGDELVTNGTFDTADGWTLGTGWTISGGVASSASGLSGSLLYPYSGNMVDGKTYLVEVDLNVSTSGNLFLQLTGGTSVNIGSAGTRTERLFLVAGSLTSYDLNLFANTTLVGSIDNISVREVLFDQTGAPLTLFNHPADIPRIEYNADGERLGLLVEEARTNLITYSEDFSNAAWTKDNISITSNTTIAPNGTTTASNLEASTSSINSLLLRNYTATGFTSVVTSVFVKRVNSDWFALSNTAFYAYFNISTGTVGTVGHGTASITDAGNGWWYISWTQSSGLGAVRIRNVSGDNNPSVVGGEQILIWGAQLEAGAFPTSYIPTSGATATRAADVCSIPVSAFGYNQAEGTVVVDVASRNSSGSHVVNINDGTTNNRIAVFGNVSMYSTSGGVNDVNSSLGTPSSQAFKAAVSVADNNYAGCLNGGSLVTDQTAVVPVSVSSVRIGADQGGTNPINGHIKSIQYIPRRLTNAQLVELTS